MDHDDYVLVTGSDSEGSLELEEKPEVIAKIKEWLSPTEFDSDTSEYKKHLNAHVQGTGRWILATDQYKRWDETDEIGDLWIRGIPGSGKSVVAANLVRNLQRRGDAPVLFFFFRHIIMSNRTPMSLIRDFSFQLVDYSRTLQSGLSAVMRDHSSVDEVPVDDLWRCLCSALSRVKKVYCVVDALDEMELGHDKFLSNLVDLGRRNPKSIKVALTSRQIPYLETHLKGSCLVDLRLDRRNVDNDIAVYVSSRLKHCQVNLAVDEADKIKKAICDRGKGLFLYARLMMDQCLQNPGEFMTQLEILPDGLGHMYTDLLRKYARLSATSEQFQLLVLQWVTHSVRPLRLLELAAIINSVPGRGGLSADQDAKLAVRSCCGPLLEICEDEVVQIIHHSFTEFLLDPDVRHIQMNSKHSVRFSVIDPSITHKMITLACLNYLRDCFADWTVLDRWTFTDDRWDFGHRGTYSRPHKDLMLRSHFLQYSAQNWPFHAAKVAGDDSEIRQHLDEFLQSESHDFESWKDFWLEFKTDIPANLTPLHISAYCGLVEYTEHLLTGVAKADLDIQDAFERTPIAYAAMAGQSDAVAVLLKYGARYDLPDRTGLLPIHHAAKVNRARVVRKLLEAGAEPLAPKSKEEIRFHRDSSRAKNSTIGETALFYVCRNGHLESLLELEKFLDVEKLLNGPLHWASETGRRDILAVLLGHELIRHHIDDKDANGNTPLYLATRERDSGTVRILLQNGADVNSRSNDFTDETSPLNPPRVVAKKLGNTPLHGWARINGYRPSVDGKTGEMEEVLELLFQAGCDINAQDDNGKTALFAWDGLWLPPREDVASGFISMLLKRGADPSVIDSEGNTPVHQTTRHMSWNAMYKKPLKLLIDAGANINAARKTDGITPLMVAAQGQMRDPSIFHELGADFNRQDMKGNTAFHYACRSWCMELKHAELWLLFSDPTIQNNAGRVAMTAFMWGNGGQGRVDAISLMMKKGLSLETRDYLGRTLLLNYLMINSYGGSDHFAKELIRLGADTRAKDFQGKSALHLLAASQLSYKDGGKLDIEEKVRVMEDLIKAGADPRAVDYDGNTIFHDAISWNTQWPHVKTALEAVTAIGVQADTVNHQGRTILHIAAGLDDGVGKTDKVKSRLDFALQPHLNLDVNAGDYQRLTPIHIAARVSDVNLWKLIQSGGDIQLPDLLGRTPLHHAAAAGKSCSLLLLVGLYQDRSLPVDCQNLKGRTPLHEAARLGRLESVKLLLDAGADPNIKDKHGRTPLHASAEFEDLSRARVAQNARENDDPLKEQSPHWVDEKPLDAFDKMELIISSEETCIREVVRLLLAAGSGPENLDDQDQTPSDVALMLGNATVVNELAPRMATLYAAGPTAHDLSSLQSLDPFGEGLIFHFNQNIKNFVEALDFDSDSVRALERVISYGSDALVEEIVRYKRPRLVKVDGSSALHLVARCGLTAMMKRLIPYVEDLQACSPPLLHVALDRSIPNMEMVKLLINSGVDLNAIQQTPDRPPREPEDPYLAPVIESTLATAIHTLATGKYFWHTKALRLLLDAGADTEIKNQSGETAVQLAVSASNSQIYGQKGFWCDDVLDVLLENGAKVNIIALEKDLTPLNAALENRRGAVMTRKLLDHGADPSFGPKPAIASAIDVLDHRSIKILLQAGADPNTVYKVTETKRYDDNFKLETALINAACPASSHGLSDFSDSERVFRKRISIMTLLLEHGANPLQAWNEGASTVFHEIAGLNGLVKPFIEAHVDLESKDAAGRTLLLRACDIVVARYSRAIEIDHASIELIRGGADVHAVDNTGSTTLHYAIKSSLFTTVELLLQHGVSTTAKDKSGFSPLSYALLAGGAEDDPYDHSTFSFQVVTDLLDAGADPLEIGPSGKTALHRLAPLLMRTSSIDGKDLTIDYPSPPDRDYFAEYSKLYNRFVDAGCDRNARNDDGNTPLFPYVAEVKTYCELSPINPPDPKDMRKMFAQHDIFAVNNAGDTLLHVVAAREKGYESQNDGLEVFKLLVELGLDPRRENKKGVTSLDVAAACGNEEILGLFSRDE